MGSDWGRNLKSSELILGGLRFAEKGEFLEAIDLWEEALSVGSTGSTEAAYLCIALLEDHLRALHEGDELPFPDFRDKLAEISFDTFDALEQPTKPIREATRQSKAIMDAARKQEDPSKQQPRYTAAVPPPPAHRTTPARETTDEIEEDDSDLWEVPEAPSQELSDSGDIWAGFDEGSNPSGNVLEPIADDLSGPTTGTSIELELPNPIEPASVRLGQIRPVLMRVEQPVRSPSEDEGDDPMADPFDVLREPDESLPELPPPRDYADEPEERLLSFDLDPLGPLSSNDNSDSGDEEFEIVIDDSGGFERAPLKPWEQQDDSGVLDLAENERLPDTGTHDWGQSTPWSVGKGDAGFGPAPARHRLKSTHTSDRAFDELDLPEDPTGQIHDEVLQEALTHHELGDYHSSQSLIEEHLASFPNDPRLDDIRKENLRQIEMKYLAKIGSLEARPVVAISADQLVWHNLNKDKGFVLSRVDGKMTVADLVEIVHLSRHETLKLLAELASDGIIHFP